MNIISNLWTPVIKKIVRLIYLFVEKVTLYLDYFLFGFGKCPSCYRTKRLATKTVSFNKNCDECLRVKIVRCLSLDRVFLSDVSLPSANSLENLQPIESASRVKQTTAYDLSDINILHLYCDGHV